MTRIRLSDIHESMKTVSIIRNRGQLTIPDNIRKAVSWVNPMSAVSITVVNSDAIVIKPHHPKEDQEAVWAAVKEAHSIKGKNGKLSKFIAEDRYNH